MPNCCACSIYLHFSVSFHIKKWHSEENLLYSVEQYKTMINLQLKTRCCICSGKNCLIFFRSFTTFKPSKVDMSNKNLPCVSTFKKSTNICDTFNGDRIWHYCNNGISSLKSSDEIHYKLHCFWQYFVGEILRNVAWETTINLNSFTVYC